MKPITAEISQYFKNPDSVLSRQFRKQLCAAFIVNIILFSHGIGIGWLSPTLSKLQSDDSPVSFLINLTEASWIGSLVGIGSLLGNIIFGGILDVVGRKACLNVLAFPHLTLWLLIYFADSVEYLYVGRFLGGITGGGGYCVIAIFVSEIADSKIRGTLSSMMMLSVNTGITTGIILSSYLQYHLIPLVVIAMPIVYFCGTLFLPESPIYLLRKGKYFEGEKAFKFYKNCSGDDVYSELQKCNEEFDELKATIVKSQANSRLTLSDFTTRDALKAFGISLVLIFVNQFCGAFAFVSYMTRIFEASGSIIDANSSAILTGVMQIIGSYSATFFVDRYGRKLLLLISTGGMCVSLIVCGLYTFLAERMPTVAEHNWIPLVLMLCFIFMANVGIMVVIIVVIVEVFPVKLRAFGTSFSMIVLSAMLFGVLKVFPLYLDAFGISITMWSCAVVCFLGFVFFHLCLEETRGKSMVADST